MGWRYEFKNIYKDVDLLYEAYSVGKLLNYVV